jgi:hypothetical protein
VRDRDARDGGAAEVVVRDQKGVGHGTKHVDLLADVLHLGASRRLDLTEQPEAVAS